MKWATLSAEQGFVRGEGFLGILLAGGVKGSRIKPDYVRAAQWLRKAAEKGLAEAQTMLGRLYVDGHGVPKDGNEAAKWFRLAAEQGDAEGQSFLAAAYLDGIGVSQDFEEAFKWASKAANQREGVGEVVLGRLYEYGKGVPQDYVQAHMWYNLAAATRRGEGAAKPRDALAKRMTPQQIAEAQRLAREWKPQGTQAAVEAKTGETERVAAGSGFIISTQGHLLTNYHVVEDCHQLAASRPEPQEEACLLDLVRGAALECRLDLGEAADIVATDAQNDLALLDGHTMADFPATFRERQGVQVGESVIAVGYPLPGLLAEGLNVTTGVVSALAGFGNDIRLAQITAPVQPGNSGGPLLDESGNVIGVVVGKLDAIKTAKATGDIPQNVNFAIKGSVVQEFLARQGVTYSTAHSPRKRNIPEIAKRAKDFTVKVECQKLIAEQIFHPWTAQPTARG